RRRPVAQVAQRPGNAYHDQHPDQGADRNVPGHQRLPHPVLSVIDPVEQLERLPDDQHRHDPVQQARNGSITFLRVTAHGGSFDGGWRADDPPTIPPIRAVATTSPKPSPGYRARPSAAPARP